MYNKQSHVSSNPLLINSDNQGEDDYFFYTDGLDPYTLDTDEDGIENI